VDGQTQLPTEPGAINGGMMQRDERTPAPVITIDVEAIDDAVTAIEAGGGRSAPHP
jgi:predicted enzyme related to lactoylglutathione lyase